MTSEAISRPCLTTQERNTRSRKALRTCLAAAILKIVGVKIGRHACLITVLLFPEVHYVLKRPFNTRRQKSAAGL